MKINDILLEFSIQARRRGMNLSGDKSRFFNGKTARAWTKWLEEALAFERRMLEEGLTKARG